MILKNYPKGVPFLGKMFIVDRSDYLEQGTQSCLNSPNYPNETGHNFHYNLDNVIKSSIGEWIERSSLYRLDKKGSKTSAFSLIDGSEIEVESEKIYFANLDLFNDTCGIASHTISDNAIYNAYMEFYERQCLTFTWLTKSCGRNIEVKHISDPILRKLLSKIYYFVDDIYLIDISLHSDIHTIIGIGIGKYYKTIGLKADFDINNALVGALTEMIQGFGNSWTKYNLDKRETNADNSNSKIGDIYSDFYNSFTPTDFFNEWSFLLLTDGISVNINDKHHSKKNLSFSEKITIISRDLNLEPYCAMIPCFYDGFHTKIVKVFALNGYPHMFPVLYAEEQTCLKFNTDVSEFPNAYRQIPFP
ncbi:MULTISPECIES: YcaO-like family protein [Heyndrickxia]|uniref:YcaO-like family protein n=1 Tax=Heyndrickxia TaxID=2837504 RepID=UPI0015D46764|nr:YcaO-like family protein [Heyndrickxia oleronia]NYV68676.1 YcaO-like family protein [Bacillus sp. Gen3]MCI1593006.1 YcaO-like family protein [Heyndrickxia oleronia]MCI1615625.1 YcaO-like family protein [Heyndrickxia oleronia]MCI1745996.1 YcaO-like family protein [Heyndrickxia oleronia]MCI1763936.1 YcaO-like family protein [Heyndrickxia oleronia]